MKWIIQKFHDLPKRERFIAILASIAVLGVLFSLLAKVSFILEDEDDLYRIAVVAPVSGDNEGIGRSIRQGVEFFVKTVNDAGGIGGTSVAVDIYNDQNDPKLAKEAAMRIVADKRVRAVIGHWSTPSVLAAAPIYAENGIPLIVPSAVHPDVAKSSEWLFTGLFNDREQARFLANYVRNVMGNKLISMIVDKNAYGDIMAGPFAETLLRFGTKVRYTWEFDTSANVVQQIQAIVDDLKTKKDAGTLFLATDGLNGARVIKLMRDNSVRNQLVGTSALGTHAFADFVAKLPGRHNAAGKYSDGMLITTPLLFDTANETAQNFKNGFLAAYDRDPDWVAAFSYDAAQLVVHAMVEEHREGAEGEEGRIASSRQYIRDFIAGHNNPENALIGITGANFFDADGEGKKPVFIGIYNGINVISALTQLQPIKSEGARNYIDELKRGRMLYVNDRFMYKTNVVYTGLQINEISGLEVEKNQYDLDFLIWFRYRGQFEPQDLEFVNAVEPIKLTTPAEERQVGDMTYRLYRVKGKFRFNFTDTRRPYGQHVVGVGFTHRLLNKNNLQYVVDVLGLALDKGETVKDKLEDRQALNAATGWIIERAWNSQDIIAKGTMGDPAYVGFGATDPDFSQIDLGMVIKRGEFNARDFVPTEFFIYVGIFALIGTIFAVGMDRRERGRFWAAQSWFLRVISWPLLLLSGGNLAIDLAFQNLADHYIDIMILVYDSLWWLVPARLIGLAVERFLWTPLEDHTERNIPNVIRVFASVTVYTFAVCGIIAFVFDQTLTSILASTGLLAMIIGLAIQANISNIFSGIVINMERPFNVGDWVQIGDLDEGRVVDITWRTVRVKVRNGYVISVPNGQVSEAQIHNFNSFNAVRVELPLYLDAKYPLLESAEIMEEGLAAAPQILDSPEREVRFKGVERHPGAWVSVYEIQFWLDNYGRREEIAEGALSHVWDALMARGIYPADRPDPAVLAAIGAAVGQDEAQAQAGDDAGGGGGGEEEYELEFEDN